MERWHNRVAVVTGASSGIGVAIVKDLLKANLIVAALARRKERIEEYRKELPAEQQKRLLILRADVSSKVSVDEAFDSIIKQLGGIDILINNAGSFVEGYLATMDAAGIEQTLNVNVMGVIYATQRAFKSMKERQCNDGHVVIINSTLGHQIPQETGSKQFNILPASKYALTAITEIYRQEFQALGTNIKVTSVSPGLVDTEMVPDSLRQPNKSMLKPQDIAEVVLFAISTPPHVQISEITVEQNPKN